MAGPGVAEAVAVWVIGVLVDVFVRVGMGVLVRVCVGVCVGVFVGVGVFGASGMPAETSRMLNENTNSVVSNKLAMMDGFTLLLIDYL
jgi:hypothetical protein